MTIGRLFLSPDELYALEQRARRERAETVARLFAQALVAAKRRIARAMSMSFWKDAANSLPPHVRRFSGTH